MTEASLRYVKSAISSARLNFGGLTLSTSWLSTVRSTDSLSQRTWSVDPFSCVTHPLTNAWWSSLSHTHRLPENSARSRAESVEVRLSLVFVIELMNLGLKVPVDDLRGRLSITGPGIFSVYTVESFPVGAIVFLGGKLLRLLDKQLKGCWVEKTLSSIQTLFFLFWWLDVVVNVMRWERWFVDKVHVTDWLIHCHGNAGHLLSPFHNPPCDEIILLPLSLCSAAKLHRSGPTRTPTDIKTRPRGNTEDHVYCFIFPFLL